MEFLEDSLEVKRVLMTADAVGGVWTYVLECVEQFSIRGIEVALATMGPLPDKKQREEVCRFGNVELFESNYKLEWMENPWKEIEEAGEWLLDLEIIVHPDIVHLNGFVHGAYSWHAPVVVVGHSCVCSWLENVKKSTVLSEIDKYKKKVTEGLLGADFVVAPSAFMLDALRKHYGIYGSLMVIPNGRNPRVFKSVKKEPFIFTAGRIWDEAKNIAMLTSLADRFSWPIYVAGEPGENNGLSDKVKFLGKLSNKEIVEVMSRASIFSLPSKYDPFGLSVLEAGISGCALVLGDIPSYREIWGDTALFVNPEDPDMLERQIEKFIDDCSLLREYGSKAHKRSLQYTSNKMAERYVDLYHRLLIDKKNLCG